MLRVSKRVAILAVLGLATATAFAQKLEVSHNRDKTANFEAIKTYAWLASPPPPKTTASDVTNPGLAHEVIGPQITAAIDKQIARRGWQKAGQDQADVLVVYYAAMTVGFDSTVVGETYAYATGWASVIPPGLAPTSSLTVIETGTIIVDIVQRDPRKAIWRGTMKTRVNQENTEEKRVARINEATERVFRDFPVRPKN